MIKRSMNLQALSAANPSLANAHNGLGVAYAAQKDWPKAIESWKKALTQNNQNYDAMLNLAYAYLEVQDKPNALLISARF